MVETGKGQRESRTTHTGNNHEYALENAGGSSSGDARQQSLDGSHALTEAKKRGGTHGGATVHSGGNERLDLVCVCLCV